MSEALSKRIKSSPMWCLFESPKPNTIAKPGVLVLESESPVRGYIFEMQAEVRCKYDVSLQRIQLQRIQLQRIQLSFSMLALALPIHLAHPPRPSS